MQSSVLELLILSMIVGAVLWVSGCGQHDVSSRTHVDTVSEVGTVTYQSPQGFSFQFPASGYVVKESEERVTLHPAADPSNPVVVIEVGGIPAKGADVVEIVRKAGEPFHLSFPAASRSLRNLIIRTFDAHP